MTVLPITKMHGIGNSYVLIDDFHGNLETRFDYRALAKAISDKSYGVGSDGLLVAREGKLAPYWMRVLNPDGSEAEMCGNGIRMFARYLHDLGLADVSIDVEVGGVSGGKTVRPYVNDDRTVTVDMGKGEILESGKQIEVQFYGESSGHMLKDFVHGDHISVGNPHFVVREDTIERAKRFEEKYGSLIENHQAFQPARTNVEYVTPLNRDELFVYVWERGAGATLACGTGACASQFAMYKSGFTWPEAIVHLPGGDLQVVVLSDDTIMMTGPAEYIFTDAAIPDVERFLSVYQDFEKRNQ